MTTSHLQSSQLVRTSSGAYVVAGADTIWRSADGTASVSMGGNFAFDPGHGLLYASNLNAGMWRVRVR
jgi:hypothetical protein